MNLHILHHTGYIKIYKLGTEIYKPATVNQQCLVYKFQCILCDAGYVGYTHRHLHECVDGHKQKLFLQIWFTWRTCDPLLCSKERSSNCIMHKNSRPVNLSIYRETPIWTPPKKNNSSGQMTSCPCLLRLHVLVASPCVYLLLPASCVLEVWS